MSSPRVRYGFSTPYRTLPLQASVNAPYGREKHTLLIIYSVVETVGIQVIMDVTSSHLSLVKTEFLDVARSLRIER